MRTFTTEYTVYMFDELSDEAKEKALQIARDDEQEWGLAYTLEEDLKYKLEQLLKQHKIVYDELPKVYYSLNYCQGDGAMFEGRVTWRGYTADIRHSGMYYHYNSKEIDLTTAFGNPAKDKACDAFNELYVDICRELERYGYDVIDSALSDDILTDKLVSNEYEFYEDGSWV